MFQTTQIDDDTMTFILMICMTVFLTVVPSGAGAVPPADNIHTVQVSASRSHDEALKEMKTLKRMGFSPFMLDIYDGRHILWHTVHIGHHAHWQAAQKEALLFTKKMRKKAAILSLPATSFALFKQRVASGETGREDPKTSALSPSDLPVEGQERVPDGRNSDPGPQAQEPSAPVVADTREGQSEPDSVLQRVDSEQEGQPASFIEKRYVLASLSLSHMKKDSATGTTSIDTSGLGGKITGGYKFTEHLGIEAGYVQFQKVDTKVANAGLVNSAVNNAPLTMEGAVVEGVVTWDVHPSVSLIGKAGEFLWRGEATVNGQSLQARRKENGVDLVFGVGTDFRFWDHKILRVEWDHFLTPDEVDLLSVGLGIEF